MTTDFKCHPEFCRRDTDKGVDTDFDKVITDLPKSPGLPSATVMKLKYEKMRIAWKSGSHNLHSDMNDREEGTFHTQCMKSDMHVWIFACVLVSNTVSHLCPHTTKCSMSFVKVLHETFRHTSMRP
jgi:hypothetical protein